LIAESTGKGGKGTVPIIDEPPLDAVAYPSDRLFIGLTVQGEEVIVRDRLKELEEAGHPTIQITLKDRIALGQEMFNWEIAVASAATVLGINPFNQPDVKMTKELAEKMMAAGRTEEPPQEYGETLPIDDGDSLRDALTQWSSQSKANDYVSIQAYLEPGAETSAGLRQVRQGLLFGLNVATSLDYGPRFLHSTGQLHKGGPNTGLFLQLIDDIVDDLEVPETDYTFGELIQASSSGDYLALRQRGRRILRINLGTEVAENLSKLDHQINDLTGREKMKIIVTNLG
jgi:transaldolase/glucose-6-phosphate isomerase